MLKFILSLLMFSVTHAQIKDGGGGTIASTGIDKSGQELIIVATASWQNCYDKKQKFTKVSELYKEMALKESLESFNSSGGVCPEGLSCLLTTEVRKVMKNFAARPEAQDYLSREVDDPKLAKEILDYFRKAASSRKAEKPDPARIRTKFNPSGKTRWN